jgi:hypothetical protein
VAVKLLQGVCGSAIQLSDRRDRSSLLVMSFVHPGLIQQVAGHAIWRETRRIGSGYAHPATSVGRNLAR